MRLDGEQHARAGRSPGRRSRHPSPSLLRVLLAHQRGGRHGAHRLRDLRPRSTYPRRILVVDEVRLPPERLVDAREHALQLAAVSRAVAVGDVAPVGFEVEQAASLEERRLVRQARSRRCRRRKPSPLRRVRTNNFDVGLEERSKAARQSNLRQAGSKSGP